MSKHLKHFLRYQFPAIGWALLIFIGSSIPSQYFPNQKIFTYDKVIHVILFFVFGVLVYRGLASRTFQSKVDYLRLLISILIVVGYGILDELHQGTVRGRSVDFYDGVADMVGGIIAAIVVILISRRSKSTKLPLE
ncbi:MAG: VanZ family protein [Ignavibacteriales bacterium]|nr:VanZ family protein [Ignavibacteriales bacterium]